MDDTASLQRRLRVYDGEKTLRDINTAWAQEMATLYHEGFQVWGEISTIIP